MGRRNDQATKVVGFWQIVQSILAAGLGVQSHRRYEEDFSSHSPFPYILGGLIFTAAFVAVLLVIVNMVLA